MAAYAAISLNDGQATPVAHNFDADISGNGNWNWRESGTTSVLGAAIITITKLKVKGNPSIDKIRVRLYIPALETVTGQNSDGYTAQPRLAYNLTAIQDFVCPRRASEAQRKDLVAYAKNILSNSQVTDAITKAIWPN